MKTDSDFDIRGISPEALAALGAPGLAYFRPVEIDGQHLFGIFAANGRQIGFSPSRDGAILAIRQHDMEPASVH